MEQGLDYGQQRLELKVSAENEYCPGALPYADDDQDFTNNDQDFT
jgi:hypothetical protein